VIKSNITCYFIIFVLILSSSSFTQNNAFATSAIDLGVSNTFGVLSDTYTDTSSSTVTGDLGYNTALTGTPVVSGTTHHSDSIYSQAGTAQSSAISTANGLTCTNLGTVPDLSATHGASYGVGVYCITGGTTTGPTGITLTGNGDHIFKITGSLNTVASTFIHLSGGALSSGVYWIPTGTTTLGANSNFTGTILAGQADVTMGTTVTMTGRILAFGHTVTTTSDTVTVPNIPTVPVGGTGVTIDTTALLIYGISSSVLWWSPAIAIAGTCVGFWMFKKKN